MTVDMTQHGMSEALYQICGCQTCATGRYRRRILRELRRNGAPAYVDSAPVFAHIAELKQFGWYQSTIAKAIGRHTGYLYQDPRPSRMRSEYAIPALALTSPGLYAWAQGTVIVPAIGAQRRWQALAAIGWRREDVFGKHETKFMNRAHMTAMMWHLVAEKYDELSMTRGPSSAGAALARSKEWLPPLVWDPETIDDPRTLPEGVRTITDDRRGPHADRLEFVAERSDWSLQRLADAMGIDVRQVSRLRAELVEMAAQETGESA